MKNYNHIEALLERYYDAQTSETEERMLKDFFLHEEVPAHLLAEKEMFLQLQASAMPEGLEERLSQSIDQWDKKRRTLRLQWIGSIAASLLLLFGTGWYLQEPPARTPAAPLRKPMPKPKEHWSCSPRPSTRG